MGVLAKAADGQSAALPDLGHHEWYVEEAVDRVVSDQQRTIGREVLDAVELRLDYAADGLEQRDEAVDRSLGGEFGNFGRLIGHRKPARKAIAGIVIREQVRGHHALCVM